jgi:hypothetical protein
VSTAKAESLIPSAPKQILQLGADEGSVVGEYQAPFALTGGIDELRLYHAALDRGEIEKLVANETQEVAQEPVLALSLENGLARNGGAVRLDGEVAGAKKAAGKFGDALQFAGQLGGGPGRRGAGNASSELPKQGELDFEHKWAQDIPIYARAMALADRTLFVAGPPDVINEHETFDRLSGRDNTVERQLADQDALLAGVRGSKLLAVNTDVGEVEHSLDFDGVPAWDALAAAEGRLFLCTTDGRVISFVEADSSR